jgi:hypothetical protein
MDEKPSISPNRVAIWAVVAAVGLYLVVSGVIGALPN